MTMKIRGGLAGFTEQGVEVTRKPSSPPLVIPWSNVMFICPVPSVKKQGAGWVTLTGDPVTEATLRDGQRFYALQVALQDRKALKSASLFTKTWLRNSLGLAPLFTANGKPDPANGYMTLDLSPDWIRENGRELLSALDSAAAYSRFDLIVTTG
jgi:hypothetical protein